MKRYTVAQARMQLSHLLDAAEAGDPVMIERRGTRFRLQADRRRQRESAGRSTKTRSLIEYVDPRVLDGQWTWEWAQEGLRFAARRKR